MYKLFNRTIHINLSGKGILPENKNENKTNTALHMFQNKLTLFYKGNKMHLMVSIDCEGETFVSISDSGL